VTRRWVTCFGKEDSFLSARNWRILYVRVAFVLSVAHVSYGTCGCYLTPAMYSDR
jgi:hypothetical protein